MFDDESFCYFCVGCAHEDLEVVLLACCSCAVISDGGWPFTDGAALIPQLRKFGIRCLRICGMMDSMLLSNSA